MVDLVLKRAYWGLTLGVLALSLAKAAAASDRALERIGAADPSAAKYFTVNLRPDASPTDARTVAEYFRGFGLTVDERNGILFAHGTLGQAAAAGRTSFASFRLGDVTFVRAAQAVVFPPEIRNRVLATTLDGGAPSGGARVDRFDFTLLPKYGFLPAGLATYYDAASLYSAGTNGTGEDIALVACDTFAQSDLTAFESLASLPNNKPTVVSVDGGSTKVSAIPTVDVESLVGAAPGANITVYVAPSSGSPAHCTLAQLADQFAAIAADMTSKHYVAVADGDGASEDFYASSGSSSDMTATDADIKKIDAAGGTVFAASGVWGAGPPRTEVLSPGEFTIFFPASDPNAIAVGGTAAVPQSSSNLTRKFELAWGGSGGGVSSVYAIPSYQKHVAGIASTTMRNVPDVAFVSSPNTAVTAYFSGTEISTSGTSVGADYWAGFTALADQSRKAVGKALLKGVATKLYAARALKGMFTPISRGCNGYYCASTKEYNNVTGIGVPDVAKLVAHFTGLP